MCVQTGSSNNLDEAEQSGGDAICRLKVRGATGSAKVSATTRVNCVRGATMRRVKWLSCLWAAGLAGCSLYPIPDDVASVRTEDIVRHARCEIRSEIIGYLIERQVLAPSATDKEIAAVVKDIKKTNGMAGFSLPTILPNGLSGDGNATLDLMRSGVRHFETGDVWDELLTNDTRCAGVRPRPGNIVYPVGGSIGVGRAIRTYIDIVEQGGGELGMVTVAGAKNSFVDTLTFTTIVSAGATATLTLAPVPHSFRIVSAEADVMGSRTDTHTLILSLAFPHPLDPPASLAPTGVKFEHAPFQRPPQWRARYNLCVQDGRQRENAVKLVRLEAPEVYCITFADAYEPRPGQSAAVVRQPSAPNQPPAAAPRGNVRPNRQ